MVLIRNNIITKCYRLVRNGELDLLVTTLQTVFVFFDGSISYGHDCIFVERVWTGDNFTGFSISAKKSLCAGAKRSNRA